ncbi:F-box protein At3g07870-like [Papaver somniferum]|uniref:F-box protein At3g07870-like n=1 Tax=Papaver somniferum TaxID=3469 RepID=UPI000E6FBF90|nr:F-box protein At3g07870-like [Papaver somniferum]
MGNINSKNCDSISTKNFIMGRFKIEDLPKEMIPEILSRLPTESVLECKLVCKSWRDIIHFPSFSQKHLNHLTSAGDSGKLSFVFLSRYPTNINPITGQYLMLEEFTYAEYDENSHEAPFNRKVRIYINLPFYRHSFAGSCNGLICLDSWHKDIYGATYIFNPVTREYVILPTSEGSNYWSGFGYIPSTNEYKVVRIYNSLGDSNVRLRSIQVYTLGSSTGWRNVGTMDRTMQFYRKDAGAFVNGALYWADEEGTILAFHLADEKFSKLPSPPWFTRSEIPPFPISLGV